MSRGKDIRGIFKGLQIVGEAIVKTQSDHAKHLWVNSSIREAIEHGVSSVQNKTETFLKDPGKELESVANALKETVERSSTVTQGIRTYASTAAPQEETTDSSAESADKKVNLAELDISSVTLKEMEQILSEIKQKKVRLRYDDKKKSAPTKVQETLEPVASPTPPSAVEDTQKVKNILDAVANYDRKEEKFVTPDIKLPELSVVAKQRKVPASRIGRVISFGNLFAGLGLGTVSQLTKGALGMEGGASTVKEAVLSPENMERIVDTLCKVRGAALKLGQILSIQDSNVVSPQLIKAFDRVRQAADYMPDWQVNAALTAELGDNWRTKLASLEEKPFAAASIGQVHRARLPDGTEIALKIQYPGVGKSIESDIDNLVSMLKVWDIFPPGMFIDNIVKVAKRELAWEVDYMREADYTEKFAELIVNHKEFKVPKVIKSLTTTSVLATELAPGVPVDQCLNLDYSHRHHLAASVMKLCLLELFSFRCMQTDPNWSNFLYDEKTRTITLIDFGATRFYPKKFMDDYLRIIIAAAKNDRETIHKYSVKMGFLTGYETQAMKDAHIDAVMILGEVFSISGEFDFGCQNTTKRVADLVPVMVANRLCPPPDEIYSLHRKLSGVFLLCSRLQAKFDAKPIFDEIVKDYKFDTES